MKLLLDEQPTLDFPRGFAGALTLTTPGLPAAEVPWEGSLIEALDWAGSELALAPGPSSLLVERAGVTPAPDPTPTPSPGPDRTADRREVIRLVNLERQSAGLRLLAEDAKLMAVAQAHADDMWRRGYFSHTSPEGRSAGDRLRAAGVVFRAWGENLASLGNPKPADAVKLWMNSPGHRANILGASWNRTGVGAQAGLYVQVFIWSVS